jgi:lambda repressor-like predicted transcriptional regulator
MGCGTSTKLYEISLQAFIEVKNALDECDAEVQAVVMDMLDIYKDNSTSQDEKQLAMHTIMDALFSSQSVDLLSSERLIAGSAVAEHRKQEMDQEEQIFSDRLRQLMTEKGIGQEQLAAQMGVGQSAISNMLNRQCRPQQRTIERAAEALGVAPEELWPAKTPSVEREHAMQKV